MWRTDEGSTARLAQLCLGYFVFYVITGVTVKYFQGPLADGFPGMNAVELNVYSTTGGTLLCFLVSIIAGWYRLESNNPIRLGPLRLPGELIYIVPSGVCTAVVIPATTLMYSLPISVMVAMVIMRGSIIVISRLVDAVQIRQGILRKKVYLVEDIAVGFALLAVSVHLFWSSGDSGFDFMQSAAAVAILGSYIAAYAIRIYIMNYFKNTRREGVKQDNKGFFAVEQIAACFTMIGVVALLFWGTEAFGWKSEQLHQLRASLTAPHSRWMGAVLSGTAFGMVAFFSVFIFMFKGRTATFAGLVNRLTSLVAGTAATLVSALFFRAELPSLADWASVGFILVAVGFLSVAERKRTAELASAR